MRTEEIKRIQKELGVDLPPHYATFLSTFEGLINPEINIGNLLYASADDVIEMNRLMGFYLNDKIIKSKLIIGDNGGGDFYLIDLVDKSDERVYVFDHEETVEKCFDKKKGSFDWTVFDKYDTVESYRICMQETFE